jgi:hypothetical protein
MPGSPSAPSLGDCRNTSAKKYPEGEAFTATVVVTKGNLSKTVKAVGECG